MEKKLTRDQALIKLLREGVEKDNRIKDLENDKKDTERRLRRLEDELKRLSRLVVEGNRTSKILKEKSYSLENEVNNVKRIIQVKR